MAVSLALPMPAYEHNTFPLIHFGYSARPILFSRDWPRLFERYFIAQRSGWLQLGAQKHEEQTR
jgi:hypothetical protein